MRKPAKNFEELIVWQKAHQFVLSIYKVTREFPQSEIYGLTSQLRRSAVSVPANIAEGFKKKGKADKVRYLNIAQASLEESRYYLILTNDLKYTDSSQPMLQLVEVSKLLEAYSRSILTSSFWLLASGFWLLYSDS
jgi:four helix bundle protein